ncbi:hypothetical protein HRbin36_02833 [bacterium HR36]|nr:hypothetical protein HRbin36_02833 [bacterium HR36]
MLGAVIDNFLDRGAFDHTENHHHAIRSAGFGGAHIGKPVGFHEFADIVLDFRGVVRTAGTGLQHIEDGLLGLTPGALNANLGHQQFLSLAQDGQRCQANTCEQHNRKDHSPYQAHAAKIPPCDRSSCFGQGAALH